MAFFYGLVNFGLLAVSSSRVDVSYSSFMLSVVRKSDIYKLNRMGAKTVTCGNPLFIILVLLIFSSRTNLKYLLPIIFCIRRAVWQGITFKNLDINPYFQTVSDAGVKSKNRADVFKFCRKPASIYDISAITWSRKLRPGLNHACCCCMLLCDGSSYSVIYLVVCSFGLSLGFPGFHKAIYLYSLNFL